MSTLRNNKEIVNRKIYELEMLEILQILLHKFYKLMFHQLKK